MAEQDSITSEQWAGIPEFSEYQASSLGRIRSFKAVSGQPKIMKPRLGSRGYYQLVLTDDSGKRRTIKVCRFVLLAFVGHCPVGMECCHEDDCKTNDRLSNLRWDTKLKNAADAARNGRRRIFSTEEIAEMVRLDESGIERQAIAAQFGCGNASISRTLKTAGRPADKIKGVYRVDPEMVQEMIRLEDSGVSRSEIAERLGIAKATVTQNMIRIGRPAKSQHYSDEQLSEMDRLALLGMSRQEIGLRVGIDKACVARLLIKRGFPRLGRGRFRKDSA